MAKVLSVGGIGKFATAGVLLAAGAAVNRLFRPFGATMPRGEQAGSPVLALAVQPREPLAGPVAEPVSAAPTGRLTGPASPPVPARPARPASAVLTRRGASRKAWRCV